VALRLALGISRRHRAPVALHRVLVVGGSLGGLTTALLLRSLGLEVTVLERSAQPLEARGAGIVLQPETLRWFLEHGDGDLDAVSVAAPVTRWLDVDERGDEVVRREVADPHRFTSWQTLYAGLLAAFGTEHYRRGACVVDVDPAGAVVLDDGTRLEADLVVAADGIRSGVRARLAPEVRPEPAGYVGWRGTVPAATLPPAAQAALGGALVYAVPPLSHIVIYPIPGGALNYVWYRNADAATRDALLTDQDGRRRDLALPPGAVRAEAVAQLRADATELLPPSAAALVRGTAEPFLQEIVDLSSRRLRWDRVVVLGDAAFAARPHAAAGTAKACADAWSLAEHLRPVVAGGGSGDGSVGGSDDRLRHALDAWEAERLAVGHALLERVRALGHASQVAGTWTPGDPSLAFGLPASAPGLAR
jgi:2,6-dihydroxypyridine 3-monooxygenase